MGADGTALDTGETAFSETSCDICACRCVAASDFPISLSFNFADDWFNPVGDSPAFTECDVNPHDDIEKIRRLAPMATYAAAPVRANPQRNYDPRSLAADPRGNEIPSVLAHLSTSDPTAWERLKGELEEFGRDAGLFAEIRVRRLHSAGGDPFQLQASEGRRAA